MDSLVFIIALAVAGLVSWWYAANEEKKAGGAFGLLGVRLGEEAETETGKAAQRYRAAKRLTPSRRDEISAGAPAAGEKRAYRVRARKAGPNRPH